MDQLFLQADRVRGNDHSPPFRRLRVGMLFGRGAENGGHQVAKTLADAGPRLDQEMVSWQASRHRFGHFQLLRPIFVVLQPCGDSSAGPEHIMGS